MAIDDVAGMRTRIRALGLGEHEVAILRLVRPSVRLRPRLVDPSELKPGDSRFGGDPHMPPEMEWPTWDGVPLAHLATVRLSEASRHDSTGLLPKRGLLYFWYDLMEMRWGFDPDDAGSFRVDYVADEGAATELRTVPRVTPGESGDELAVDWEAPPACRLRFHPSLTLPDAAWLAEFAPEHAELGELDEYNELLAECMDASQHHMLGHPAAKQNPMEPECQMVTHGLYCGDASGFSDPRAEELEGGIADWRLLLQIDTDEEADGPGWMWGDMGSLYFWMPEQALRERDFSKAWMVLQCS
ncbi:MAG: DUF1963 domain-containing protein [Planctomycetaceae bacterium]|jgi:uncharacterized protein YwqG|nr:DUF1963 domain-containing protein [Planctomycetaceae bacterium]